MILSKWYVASLTNLSSFVNCLLGLPCRNKNNLSDHCLQIMSMFLTCHFPDIKLFLYAMSCTGCHLEGCFQQLETFLRTSLVTQWARTHLPVQEPLETWVQSLGQEVPLAMDMAAHSSLRAWRIPWTEEPGWPQSTGSQRVELSDWDAHRDVFDCHPGCVLLARNNWGCHQTTCCAQNRSLQHRTVQPKMSVVPRMRNPPLVGQKVLF